MFIEKFFNPTVNCRNMHYIFHNTRDALDHCKNHGSYIRHHSFKGDAYISFDGKNFVWNDGSVVDKRKLPRKGNGWGKYFSSMSNRNSF